MNKRDSMILAGAMILILMALIGIAMGSSHMRTDQDIMKTPFAKTPAIRTVENPVALLIQDHVPWIDANSDEQALNDRLIPFDKIRSQDLATTDLAKYEFIMYASSQPTSYYQNISQNILNIDSYVSGGGVLIAHCCDHAWENGDWSKNEILPSVRHDEGHIIGHVTDLREDIQIINTSSPISNGLTDDLLSNWHFSTHGYFERIPDGANIIMVTNNDLKNPVYIEYYYGAGKVLASMQTIEWQFAGLGFKGPALRDLLYDELDYVWPHPSSQNSLASNKSDKSDNKRMDRSDALRGARTTR